MLTILAISGSLRKASINTSLLRAVVRLAPADIKVALYRGLGELPLFNPDIESPEPAPVADLRLQIVAADAVLIASPEYAHGVTGVMKNALDWMVGNESFVYKPVALLNASPRASHAHAALRETLVTMSARILEPACITLPLLGAGIDEDGIVDHPQIRLQILTVLDAINAACAAA